MPFEVEFSRETKFDQGYNNSGALTGVSVQLVPVLTGSLSPNASLVVVATPAVGNRDQTRSCLCECLFDLFSIKRQKDTRLIGIWSLIGGTCHIEPF